MEDIRKDVVLKTVAAMAWADGKLEESEKQKLVKICTNLGLEEKEVDKVLSESADIQQLLEKIKELPPTVLVDLLQFCYRLAVDGRKIHKKEIQLLRKIGSQFWPDYRVNLMLKWLKHQHFADEYFGELFLLDQKQ